MTRERRRKAIDWTEEIQQEKSLVNLSEDSETQLILSRVLILKGDHSSLKQVSNFLRQLISAAATEGRIGIQIEALTLLALSNSQLGDAGSAMMNLEHALRLAEPEGYVRSFVDLGLPVARLLQGARSRNVMPGYTKTLLAAFDSGISSTIVAQPTLPEPLTEREEEVLELLAAGLTNPEIAEKLVISAGTVKKHASNIYGKLGVSGRTEAAARARELNLLD